MLGGSHGPLAGAGGSNFPARSQQDASPVALVVDYGGTYVPTFDYDMVEHELSYFDVSELERHGRCESATHVVVEVMVGAAELRRSNGTVESKLGVARGCAGRDPVRKAERGCHEPVSFALAPLDPEQPYVSPCLPRSIWNGVACQIDTQPCMSHEPLTCRGPLVQLSAIRPLVLAPERVPCLDPSSDAAIFDVRVDGPSGRIDEVCGASTQLETRADQLFAWQLPVSRTEAQRFRLTCPPTRIDPKSPPAPTQQP